MSLLQWCSQSVRVKIVIPIPMHTALPAYTCREKSLFMFVFQRGRKWRGGERREKGKRRKKQRPFYRRANVDTTAENRPNLNSSKSALERAATNPILWDFVKVTMECRNTVRVRCQTNSVPWYYKLISQSLGHTNDL